MKFNKLFLAVAAIGSSLPAVAADAEYNADLPTVHVVGQTTPPARSVSEIGYEQIQNEQPKDLKQLLKNEVGVSVTAAPGSRQGNDSVNIRGLSGNRVGMDIDGIPLPEAQESKIFTSTGLAFGRGNFIETTSLRSATIERGAEAEGLAGSVQFRTVDPQDLLKGRKFGGYIEGGYQSADKGKTVSGGVAAEAGIWQGMVMGTYRLGHETETRGDVGGTGATRTEADPLDYNSRYFLTKHHFQITPQQRVTLTAEHLKRNQWMDNLSKLTSSTSRGVTTTYNADDTSDKNTRNRVSLAHRYEGEGWLEQVNSQIYWQDSRTDNRRVRDYTTTRSGVSSNTVRLDTGNTRDTVWGLDSEGKSSFTTGAIKQDWRYGIKFAQHDLTYDNYSTSTTAAMTRNPSADAKITSAAAYADGTLDFGNWLLQPGLRVDYYRYSPDFSSYTSVNASAEDVKKQDKWAASPHIGVVWKLDPLLQPYAQYARGFRAPSAQQLSSSWGYSGTYSIIGNGNLKPEYADNFEIGARGKNAVFEYQIVGYNNLYKNFIDYNTVQASIPMLIQYHNFDRARIYGAEANATWKFAPNWKLNGAIAFSRGYTKNSPDTNSGDNNDGKQPINSINPLKIQLGLAYDTERWGGNVLLTRVNGKSSSQISGSSYNPTRHYTLVDLGAYWKPTKNLSLSAGVNNLFNQKYWNWADISYLAVRSTYSGAYDYFTSSMNATNADYYTAPGRNFTLGLRYTF
ncbi:hemoglobin/transferrin/lactoferrin receptor protein [Neisseria perflava]|uniref:TonB-dependent hemoglobin/transferrin/lactoferrin family receptor n=1 Tax=Neisseria perflava TaxID=33053 RepID=UPI00209FCFF2|nr:TonB-dependent hemoglobin/transferrin/lactoferrin family receptor [Neisseria perflava]MCP1771517.1 hemoglobin/transferrin/lactoferrin receptor protein [Neisseria perflava]